MNWAQKGRIGTIWDGMGRIYGSAFRGASQPSPGPLAATLRTVTCLSAEPRTDISGAG